MKITIIGSRFLYIKAFEKYLPKNVTEIVSGGTKAVGQYARNYVIDLKSG